MDALTYGLATLVMAGDVFGEGQSYKHYPHHVHRCGQCGRLDQCPHPAMAKSTHSHKIRRGNNFAQYTKKFSLGNGPADWVQDYLITKEGGKMLGTLVALAIGRMRNLETFVWDMPTGVLRDVWLALASLADRDDGHACRLERVWVRWHDNSESISVPGNPTLITPSSPSALANSGLSPASLFQIPAYPRVEFPTFSILPPLKSLSVLDIDELPYVQELSILIERSVSRLRELRIGLARHAMFDSWASLPEDKIHDDAPVSESAPSSPWGLMGFLFATLEKPINGGSEESQAQQDSQDSPYQARHNESEAMKRDGMGEVTTELPPTASSSATPDRTSPAAGSANKVDIPAIVTFDAPIDELAESLNSKASLNAPLKDDRPLPILIPPKAPRKLDLETLELERVSISVRALSRSINWSALTSLTILGCPHHDQLWKALRRRFSPRHTPGSSSSSPLKSPSKSPHTPCTPKVHFAPQDYQLNLRRLHTDCVSLPLISFLKETLAPDALEWLFLQYDSALSSTVSIDQIYRGPLRRHRESLTKVLINSGEVNGSTEAGTGGSVSMRSRRWTLNREVLDFILGGQMSSIRELSVSLDYRDWHFFLQRLPFIPHLRSLHIPFIFEHPHGRNLDSKELALQIVDVVALRPELELCFLGVQSKCFEVVSYAAGQKRSLSDDQVAELDDNNGVGTGPDHHAGGGVVGNSHQQQHQQQHHHHHTAATPVGDGDEDPYPSHSEDEDNVENADDNMPAHAHPSGNMDVDDGDDAYSTDVDDGGDDDYDEDDDLHSISSSASESSSASSSSSHSTTAPSQSQMQPHPHPQPQQQGSGNGNGNDPTIDVTSGRPSPAVATSNNSLLPAPSISITPGLSPTATSSLPATPTAAPRQQTRRRNKKNQKKIKSFKLREILFYDDKVAIFRARHGKL